jgi:hypothetical protein
MMGNVFGETPNTAGEGARAPRKSKHLSGFLAKAAGLLFPVGESPTGTGESPVPPRMERPCCSRAGEN